MVRLFATCGDGISTLLAAGKRRRGLHVAAPLLLLGLFRLCGAAQPGPCTQSVPVTVALQDGRIIRGLRPGQFDVRVHGQPATVASAALDTTPKRILLLMDLSKQISNRGWTLIADLAAYLVHNARREDRFALLTFAGPREWLDFDQPRAALEAKLAAFLKQRPGGGDDDPIVDGMLEGLTLFGPPRFGDTILVFTRGQDQGSRAQAKQLPDALLAHRTRLFAISTGPKPEVVYFQFDVPAPRGTQLPPTGLLPINRELQDLAEGNGGVLFSEDTELAERTYVLTEPRFKELQELVWHMYGQMVEPYRLTLSRSGEPSDRKPERFEAGLTQALAKRLAGRAVLLYPRTLPPCDASPRP